MNTVWMGHSLGVVNLLITKQDMMRHIALESSIPGKASLNDFMGNNYKTNWQCGWRGGSTSLHLVCLQKLDIMILYLQTNAEDGSVILINIQLCVCISHTIFETFLPLSFTGICVYLHEIQSQHILAKNH